MVVGWSLEVVRIDSVHSAVHRTCLDLSSNQDHFPGHRLCLVDLRQRPVGLDHFLGHNKVHL